MSKVEDIISVTSEEVFFLKSIIEAFADQIEKKEVIYLIEQIQKKLLCQEIITESEKDKANAFEEIIEDYNDKIFWKELIERLTTKEMVNKYGKGKIEEMSDEEFQKKFEEFENPIIDEISNNGIGNIIINNVLART